MLPPAQAGPAQMSKPCFWDRDIHHSSYTQAGLTKQPCNQPARKYAWSRLHASACHSQQLSGISLCQQDVFEDDESIHLVMELCAGGALLDRLKSGAPTERYVASIVRSVLRFIAQCHAKGIIYRDVKPDNFLFLTREPESPIRATDFGLSIRYHSSITWNVHSCMIQCLPPIAMLLYSGCLLCTVCVQMRAMHYVLQRLVSSQYSQVAGARAGIGLKRASSNRALALPSTWHQVQSRPQTFVSFMLLAAAPSSAASWSSCRTRCF